MQNLIEVEVSLLQLQSYGQGLIWLQFLPEKAFNLQPIRVIFYDIRTGKPVSGTPSAW